jgi:hypothetical protein
LAQRRYDVWRQPANTFTEMLFLHCPEVNAANLATGQFRQRISKIAVSVTKERKNGMGEQKRLPVNLTELADTAIVSHA